MNPDVRGTLFDIDTFAVHDGPGIRMAVYFKGCPLACAWCHSPESQRGEPELIFLRDRCVRCGTCAAVCPRGNHTVTPEEHAIAWERCRACGTCVEACPESALAIKGYTASAEEIVAKAARLRPFFAHSGGGVTLTGGEVTQQPDFAAAILEGCREHGIHTAIETCGMCPWERLERLLEHTDLVLYDIKLIDDTAHRRWTGASNGPILANARKLAGRDVRVRVPLIPGITDTEANLRGIARFAAEAGLGTIDLLPYNPSAGAKYEWLGRPYPIVGEPQEPEALSRLAAIPAEYGLRVSIA